MAWSEYVGFLTAKAQIQQQQLNFWNQLASCYRSCLTLAMEHGTRTLVFPTISTEVYGFPLERATRIAIATVKAALDQSSAVEQVRFVCFSKQI